MAGNHERIVNHCGRFELYRTWCKLCSSLKSAIFGAFWRS